ncbi:MAG TPA: hypothetical protein PKO28_01520 [Bacilli bacterium]|nr:hypothetical protein [Bacilli bacterium]
MKAPSVTTLKKYLAAMAKTKAKYITADKLSHTLGVYPEIISEILSYFDPMITMDYEYDLTALVPMIEEFIEKSQDQKPVLPKKKLVTQKILDQYASLGDFIYKKMTIGGLLDPNTELTDKDLKVLKKLIQEEQIKRKK